MEALRRRWLALAAPAFLAVVLAACAGGPAQPSLYERLGGKPAIVAVVDQFVGNVAGDARIGHFFATTEPVAFKASLVEQLCEATGGPCKYKGRDMRTAHKGLGITDADFSALVEDLATALDEKGVDPKEKEELLGILAPMKVDIVGV